MQTWDLNLLHAVSAYDPSGRPNRGHDSLPDELRDTVRPARKPGYLRRLWDQVAAAPSAFRSKAAAISARV